MTLKYSLALFLALNLLFFTLSAAARSNCSPSSRRHSRNPSRRSPGSSTSPTTPTPTTPTTPSSPTTPTPTTPTAPTTPSSPTTPSPTTPTTPSTGTCPRDALKLGICIDALNLINVTLGTPPVQPCCSLIQGLVDLEAAICLCTALRATILGINLNLPINLSLLLNVCSRQTPRGFQCP